MGLAIVVLALVGAVLGAGLVLPHHVTIGRRVVIEAPLELVWPDVGTLSTWPEWTEWSPKNDPSYDPRSEGPNKLVWTKSQGGAGTQTLTESDPAKGIKYRLEIMGGKYLVDGRVQLTRDGTRTAVAWIDSMDYAHSYVGRYFGAGMDVMLGGMIERSLLTLKARSEERAKAKGVVAVPAPQLPEPALTLPPDEPKTAPAPPPVPAEAVKPEPVKVAPPAVEEPAPAAEPEPEPAPTEAPAPAPAEGETAP
ncbi:MAG: SRPBCC family protein [Archangiaceae bacterium]|nr:SRPBCC family protein [Archangiaceae bacterium]